MSYSNIKIRSQAFVKNLLTLSSCTCSIWYWLQYSVIALGGEESTCGHMHTKNFNTRNWPAVDSSCILRNLWEWNHKETAGNCKTSEATEIDICCKCDQIRPCGRTGSPWQNYKLVWANCNKRNFCADCSTTSRKPAWSYRKPSSRLKPGPSCNTSLWWCHTSIHRSCNPWGIGPCSRSMIPWAAWGYMHRTQSHSRSMPQTNFFCICRLSWWRCIPTAARWVISHIHLDSCAESTTNTKGSQHLQAHISIGDPGLISCTSTVSSKKDYNTWSHWILLIRLQ